MVDQGLAALPLWLVLVGGLMIGMGLLASVIKSAPISTSLIYLMVGVALGPLGFGIARIDDVDNYQLLWRLSELAVTVSLFAVGLKLRAPLRDPRWRPAVTLATVTMVVTVALVAGLSMWLLSLPLGAAILLGGILAPTDPVLAADVQVAGTKDRSRLRWYLTGEAALNDGTAFPIVFLGLGILGFGATGLEWFSKELVLFVAGGLGLGWGLGWAIARLSHWLREQEIRARGYEDFLMFGLLFLSYGLAEAIHVAGFLSVFTAALAFRQYEMRHGSEDEKAEAADVLHFTESLERALELAAVLLVGIILVRAKVDVQSLIFVAVLLFAIRPLAIFLTFRGRDVEPVHRRYAAWFGMRGIGSLYYLYYAIGKGLKDRPQLADELAGITLAAVAASVVLHGITATPLMRRYKERAAG